MKEIGASGQKVLLVEDNRHTKKILAKHIVRHEGFHVMTAETMQEAERILQLHSPDFLVLDIGLPDGNGIDLIAPALGVNPEMLILVLTVFGEDEAVIRAIRDGARGYLLKDRSLEEIGDVLLSMRDGSSPIDHRVARALLHLVSAGAPSGNNVDVDLSESERKVLSLIIQGRLYKEIAFEMDVSINTVREYVRRIYKKLEVNTRSQAALRVGEYNLSLD